MHRLLIVVSIVSSLILCTVCPAQSQLPEGKSFMRSFHSPPELTSSRFYSHAALVEGGRMVYVSGQQALDAQGQLVGRGDSKRQAEQVFANVARALAAAGATPSDVVVIETHYVSRDVLPAYREARAAFFAERTAPPPASTTVQVTGLVAEGALLEVGVTAMIPPREKTASAQEPITVVATIHARNSRGEQLERMLLSNAQKTRLEPGCLAYVVHRSLDDADVFALYETWTNRSALAAHFEMPYMKEWAAHRTEWVERSEITILQRLP